MISRIGRVVLLVLVAMAGGAHVEEVYRLRPVKMQLAKASTLLRELTYTAWIESAQPGTRLSPETNPINTANPLSNPETGTPRRDRR